jgi:hypothetical protein
MRKYGLLPRASVSYYQEKDEVWVITKIKCNSLPRGSLGYYQEKVWVITKIKWVITKRKGNSLPKESVGYYKEKVDFYEDKR